MSSDFDDVVTRGLHGYARAIARVLGVSGDSWCVDSGHPAEIYLALDTRLRNFPGRDVALLWEEGVGWSVAVETTSGEDLIVVESFGVDPLPSPWAVGAWAGKVFDGWSTGAVHVPSPREADADLPRRLAAYAYEGFQGSKSA